MVNIGPARIIVVVFPGVLAACGQDPILDRADSMAAPPASTEQAPPQTVQAPAPVQAEAPTPGQAEEPTPGQGTPPGVGQAAPPVAPTAGAQSTLSGVVSVPDWSKGVVRIDVFDGDQQAAASQSGQHPKVIAMARLDAPGAFSVQVPQSVEQVWLGGYVDVNGDDRPGPDEPAGWLAANPVSTADSASGLELELVAHPPPGG